MSSKVHSRGGKGGPAPTGAVGSQTNQGNSRLLIPGRPSLATAENPVTHSSRGNPRAQQTSTRAQKLARERRLWSWYKEHLQQNPLSDRDWPERQEPESTHGLVLAMLSEAQMHDKARVYEDPSTKERVTFINIGRSTIIVPLPLGLPSLGSQEACRETIEAKAKRLDAINRGELGPKKSQPEYQQFMKFCYNEPRILWWHIRDDIFGYAPKDNQNPGSQSVLSQDAPSPSSTATMNLVTQPLSWAQKAALPAGQPTGLGARTGNAALPLVLPSVAKTKRNSVANREMQEMQKRAEEERRLKAIKDRNLLEERAQIEKMVADQRVKLVEKAKQIIEGSSKCCLHDLKTLDAKIPALATALLENSLRSIQNAQKDLRQMDGGSTNKLAITNEIKLVHGNITISLWANNLKEHCMLLQTEYGKHSTKFQNAGSDPKKPLTFVWMSGNFPKSTYAYALKILRDPKELSKHARIVNTQSKREVRYTIGPKTFIAEWGVAGWEAPDSKHQRFSKQFQDPWNKCGGRELYDFWHSPNDLEWQFNANAGIATTSQLK